MTPTARLRRLAALPALAVLAVLLGAPTPGSAQVPFPSTVSAVASFSPGFETYVDCDGAEHLLEYSEFGVLVERTPPTTLEVTVPISYSGDLADNLVGAPTEVVIPAGEELAEILGEIDPVEEGSLIVTLEPGVGYDLGEDTIELVVDPPYELADCSDSLGIYADRVDQSITEGERPKSYGLFDFDGDGIDENYVGSIAVGGQIITYDEMELIVEEYETPVVGALPPGLTYADDRWRGAASTPGTYGFAVRACALGVLPLDAVEGDTTADRAAMTRALQRAVEDLPNVCFGTSEVSVEVLAAQAAPTGPAAAPASPISADARFTG